VLGFPCNQFVGQEPGSDADVKAFCTTSYGVTFPMFSKIDVNGSARPPLYTWLTEQATKPDGDRAGAVLGQPEPVAADERPEVVALGDGILSRLVL